MADVITVTTELNDDSWEITASVSSPDVLPAEIFTYNNTGTTTLGTYVGVCSKGELERFQVWQGSALPVFGNRFVRHDEAKISVDISRDPQIIVDNLLDTARTLKAQLSSVVSTTNLYSI